ncbi:Irc13p [Saccharomyces cerevisiae EC1118]|uniref:Irc13p n=1 Tax=Saccharomyces cerevisiae (strain Lalvin EC1118 / Prise de mousse) TaxID=643680 RepID=C8ZGY9_YEAS8|nr:Irc13p [Saccharomyces cerevisiae EC1118]
MGLYRPSKFFHPPIPHIPFTINPDFFSFHIQRLKAKANPENFLICFPPPDIYKGFVFCCQLDLVHLFHYVFFLFLLKICVDVLQYVIYPKHFTHKKPGFENYST